MILAIDGGVPVRSAPYSTYRGLDLLGAEETAAVTETLASRTLFRYAGPQEPHRVHTLERDLAAFLRVPHVVAVSSGTAALQCALVGAGMPEGAEVVVPAVTFVASVNAVTAAGGRVRFAEVDDSLTLDPALLEEALGPDTWGIMPVHLGGVVCDMDALTEVARARGLAVIEDAAQAVGATYRGRAAGTIGTVGAFSFQQDKNITAGEGGAVASTDAAVHDRANRYQDQGGQFTTSRGGDRGEEAVPFLGANLRMSEMAGAVLQVQLGRLPAMLTTLRDRAVRIEDAAIDLGLPLRRIPDRAGACQDPTFFAPSRMAARRYVGALVAEGIPAATLYGGQPVYNGAGVRAGRTPSGREAVARGRCRQSERLLGSSVTISLGATMTDYDEDTVVKALTRVHAVLGAAGAE